MRVGSRSRSICLTTQYITMPRSACGPRERAVVEARAAQLEEPAAAAPRRATRRPLYGGVRVEAVLVAQEAVRAARELGIGRQGVKSKGQERKERVNAVDAARRAQMRRDDESAGAKCFATARSGDHRAAAAHRRVATSGRRRRTVVATGRRGRWMCRG
eukprot:4470052-Prymnesium_polylepis.1